MKFSLSVKFCLEHTLFKNNNNKGFWFASKMKIPFVFAAPFQGSTRQFIYILIDNVISVALPRCKIWVL